MPIQDDFFQLFALPARFALDERALDDEHRRGVEHVLARRPLVRGADLAQRLHQRAGRIADLAGRRADFAAAARFLSLL